MIDFSDCKSTQILTYRSVSLASSTWYERASYHVVWNFFHNEDTSEALFLNGWARVS